MKERADEGNGEEESSTDTESSGDESDLSELE